MTVWLIVLLAWVAGVPALVLLLALLGLGYDELRLARSSKSRKALHEIVFPLTAMPFDCASRVHRPVAVRGIHARPRHAGVRRRP